MGLTATNSELTDLARELPMLVDARTGDATGLRLRRHLGIGGMASVFVADREPGAPAAGLDPRTPSPVAVKIAAGKTIPRWSSR